MHKSYFFSDSEEKSRSCYFLYHIYLCRDENLLISKGQLQQRVNNDIDPVLTKQHKSDSSSRSTAMKRLADYCKKYSVTADIVMSTDEQTNSCSEERFVEK
jgi:hypothetical protein